MASITLQVGDRITPGVSASAYAASDWSPVVSPSGAPPGSAVSTATVSSAGTVTFTGLTEGQSYYAYGANTYVRFTVPKPSGTLSSGTLANRPAIGSVPTGFIYTATDVSGGTEYQAQGGAWVQVAPGVLDTGGRELGYAEATANQTFTTVADVTGLSITITVASRPIMVEIWVGGVQNSIANSGVTLLLTDSANTILSRGDTVCPVAASNFGPMIVKKRLAPAAGNVTYKARAQLLTSGVATLLGGAARPMYIAAREL